MSASKRDELVQKALEVFYEGGFHAMGMDRVAKDTGVSKTAIYKHFRTKEDLILATLRLRDEQFRNWMIRRIEALATRPEDRLLAVFDVLEEWFKDSRFKSCMFIKASSEFQENSHAIHSMAAEHKRILRTYFQELAEKAGVVEAETLAGQIAILKEGAIVLAHLAGEEGIAKEAKVAASFLIREALAK